MYHTFYSKAGYLWWSILFINQRGAEKVICNQWEFWMIDRLVDNQSLAFWINCMVCKCSNEWYAIKLIHTQLLVPFYDRILKILMIEYDVLIDWFCSWYNCSGQFVLKSKLWGWWWVKNESCAHTWRKYSDFFNAPFLALPLWHHITSKCV